MLGVLLVYKTLFTFSPLNSSVWSTHFSELIHVVVFFIAGPQPVKHDTIIQEGESVNAMFWRTVCWVTSRGYTTPRGFMSTLRRNHASLTSCQWTLAGVMTQLGGSPVTSCKWATISDWARILSSDFLANYLENINNRTVCYLLENLILNSSCSLVLVTSTLWTVHAQTSLALSCHVVSIFIVRCFAVI